MTVLVHNAQILHAPKTGGAFYLRHVLDHLQTRGTHWCAVSVLTDLPRACHRNFLLANLVLVWKLLVRREATPLLLEDFYVHPWLFLFNWVVRAFNGHHRIVVLVQLFHHFDYDSAFWNGVDRLVASLFLRPAHLVVANSHTTAAECVRLGVSPQRVVVVYPGCDFADQPISRTCEGDGNGAVRLLSIGTYEPRKGLHQLIEAAALIRQTEPELFRSLELRIAGDPDCNPAYARRLVELVDSWGLQANIRLLGWCGRDRVRGLFAESDIFVLPSTQEGFGMVFAEAMYYGLPIVASRAGAVPELVEHEGNGLLFEPGDIESLAKSVVRLSKDPGLRAKLGQQGRDSARRFGQSWEDVGRAFHEALKTLDRELTQ